MEKWLKRIELQLEKAGKKGLTAKELAAKCKAKKEDGKAFRAALLKCEEDGLVACKKGSYVSVRAKGLRPAVITRLNRTYGFAALDRDGGEAFILGSRLKGAMVGDQVLLRLSRGRGDLPEGDVRAILSENDVSFTGVLRILPDGNWVRPDTLCNFDLKLIGDLQSAADGDKIVASIIRRGESHRDHKAKVLKCFGSAGLASHCCDAQLEASGISMEFPAAVMDEARNLTHRKLSESELAGRADLRGEAIFTIDGADSKDLDDAVSICKSGNIYELGVHIADVSHYVKEGSLLDEEAFARGTSIYFADRVIPMLPKELSNGICSLNPLEDRLAFSALLTLSPEGKLLDFSFQKSVIRSRVKGVYDEVNQILSGDAGEALFEKYREVLHSLSLMRELKELRIKARKERGAPEIDSTESKLLLGPGGEVLDVRNRERGEAEILIEEFMLLANEAAATLALEKKLPFVYRVHQRPDPERIGVLKETLHRLGLSTAELVEPVTPGMLSKVLDEARGKDYAPVVNKLVLRSMAKAKYSEACIGHYGLVLERYAHFTSPIRRYPDLSIHRVLSKFLKGCGGKELNKRFGKFAIRSAARSSETEQTAMQLERDCDDRYKAQYMLGHIGEEYDGIVSSVTSFGLYVELLNTVEGLVRIESLPDGEYFYDGVMELKCIHTGRRFRLGDRVRVRCTGADVSAGNVDFICL